MIWLWSAIIGTVTAALAVGVAYNKGYGDGADWAREETQRSEREHSIRVSKELAAAVRRSKALTDAYYEIPTPDPDDNV